LTKVATLREMGLSSMQLVYNEGLAKIYAGNMMRVYRQVWK